MAGIYVEIPPESGGGGFFDSSPAATFAALPVSGAIGEAHITLDTGVVYWWNGSAWIPIDAMLSPGAAADTNSIDTTITAGVLTADLKLSVHAASAGNFLALTDIQTDGLRVQVQDSDVRAQVSGTAPVSYNAGTGVFSMHVADATHDGYLSQGDWSTFNSKLTSALPANDIFVGSAGNVATAVAMSGEASIVSSGAVTLSNAAVIAKVLTGFVSGPGVISAADSILTAIEKSDGNTSAKLDKAGITTGAAASTGNLGENITATVAANTSTGIGSTGTYGAVTSITLTAGDWLVDGVAGLSENGADLTTGLQVGISASATGSGINEFYTQLHPYLVSSTSDALISAPPQEFNVSSPTIVYLNTRFYYTSGTPQHRGMIRAKRIANGG